MLAEILTFPLQFQLIEKKELQPLSELIASFTDKKNVKKAK